MFPSVLAAGVDLMDGVTAGKTDLRESSQSSFFLFLATVFSSLLTLKLKTISPDESRGCYKENKSS